MNFFRGIFQRCLLQILPGNFHKSYFREHCFFPPGKPPVAGAESLTVLKNMQQIYRRAPMLKYDFSKGHKFVSHSPTFIEFGAH